MKNLYLLAFIIQICFRSYGQSNEFNLNLFVSNSDVIVEATITEKITFRDPFYGMIKTRYTIEVHKVFKGDVGNSIEIIEDGGILGDEMVTVSHSFNTKVGEQGITHLTKRKTIDK